MKFPWFVPAVLSDQISHLPPDLKSRVRRALDDLREKPETGKPLEEDLEGHRSYRIGRYRLIYRIEKERLVLEALGPRSHIYERFVLELGRQKIRERAAKYRNALKAKAKPAKK